MSESRPPARPQTAYQRWELASLAEAPVRSAADEAAAHAELLARELRTARETGLQQGQQQGYQTGLREGRLRGYDEGHAEGVAQAQADNLALQQELTQALTQLGQQFGQELAQARELLARQLLDLALDMAQAMLCQALELQPERLLGVIDQALQELPLVRQPAVLRLHPQDLELVKAARGSELQAAGWRLQADGQLARGGCLIETGDQQIDASLPARWQRLLHSLGRDGAWLEPTA